MDLTKMTEHDLAELQAALSALGKAASKLSEGGLEPEISITQTATVLRTRSIIGGYADASDVVIEIEEPEVEAVAAPPPEAIAPAPVAMPAPTRARPTPEAPRMVTTQAGARMVKGPFSDEERAKVRAMLAEGRSVDEIAAALNRRKQAVSTLLRNPAMKPGKPAAAQIAPEHAGLSGTRAAPAGAAPPPPGLAGPSACLAADTPGAAPHPARGDQARGDQAPTNGTPWRPAAQASAPAELSGEARALWHELAGLRPDPAFDIEADYDLVEGLAQGRKLAEVALDLGVDAAVAKARFATLSEPILDARGRVRLDGQQALLKALKARVSAARAGAH